MQDRTYKTIRYERGKEPVTVHSVVDAWYARALFHAYAREHDGDYILKLFSKSGYCLKKIQRISQLTRAINYKDRMIKNSKI